MDRDGLVAAALVAILGWAAIAGTISFVRTNSLASDKAGKQLTASPCFNDLRTLHATLHVAMEDKTVDASETRIVSRASSALEACLKKQPGYDPILPWSDRDGDTAAAGAPQRPGATTPDGGPNARP